MIEEKRSMSLETKDFDDIRALLTSRKAYITSKERVRLLYYLKSVLLLAEPDGLLDVVKQSQRDLLGNTAKLPYIKREWRETFYMYCCDCQWRSFHPGKGVSLFLQGIVNYQSA